MSPKIPSPPVPPKIESIACATVENVIASASFESVDAVIAEQ